MSKSSKSVWSVAVGGRARLIFAVAAAAMCSALVFTGCSDKSTGGGSSDYTLTVNILPDTNSGTITLEPEKKTYKNGDTVWITATPKSSRASQHKFIGWDWNDSAETSTENPLPYVVKGNKHVINANFQSAYLLTVRSADTGGTVSHDNTTRYLTGEKATLTAEPKKGYTFTNWSWSGELEATDSLKAEITVTVSGSKTIEAHFERTPYALTINIDPDSTAGSVRKNPNRSAYYDGDKVTLTAEAKGRYKFISWDFGGDADEITDSATTITVESDVYVTALFDKYYTLSVDPTNGGTVTRDAGRTKFLEGDTITLTAEASDGFVFDGWSGGVTSANNTIKVTFEDADVEIAANFKHIEYAFTLKTKPETADAADVSVTRSPNKATYHKDDVVTLTPAPTPTKYKFVKWEGETLPNSSNRLTIGGATEITAVFERVFTLTLSQTTDGGSIEVIPAKIAYDSAEVVTVVAKANTSNGYRFAGWTGASTSDKDTVKITMDGDKTLNADFQLNEFTLTVSGSNFTSVASPTANGTGGKYKYGTVVTVTATPNADFRWENWTIADSTAADNAAGRVATVRMTRNVTLTGNTVARTTGYFVIDVTSDPVGGGTVSGWDGEFASGTAVTLTPTANSGFVFDKWTVGGQTSTASTYTITVDKDTTVTAHFKRLWQLTAAASPSAGGTVSLSPTGGSYVDGSTVSVTATNSYGYHFTGWSGASTATTPTVSVTMNSPKTLTANFAKNTYTLTVETGIEGGKILVEGVPASSEPYSYEFGTNVFVTAEADAGYRFKQWTDALDYWAVGEDVANVLINGNIVVGAEFEFVGYTLTVQKNNDDWGSVSQSLTEQWPGTSVTVNAYNTVTGYHFVRWTNTSGAVLSTSSDYTFTITKDTTVVAHFDKNPYSITINPVPQNGNITFTRVGTTLAVDSVRGNVHWFKYSDVVTVRAVPNTGYMPIGWAGTSGNLLPQGLDVGQITIDGNKQLSAIFGPSSGAATARITFIPIVPEGVPEGDYGSVRMSVAGGASQLYTYYNNAVINTNQTIALTAAANPQGYKFSGWRMDNQDNALDVSPNVSFTLYNDRTVYFYFEKETYTVNVTSPVTGGTASITAGSKPLYNYGDLVTVTAAASGGYTFVKWTENGEDVDGATNQVYTFNVTGNRNLTPVFSTVTYDITASVDPNGAGTFSGKTTGYTHGEPSSLTVTANDGWNFVNWTSNGTEVSTSEALNITVNDNITVIANFTPRTYALTLGTSLTGGSIKAYSGTTELTTSSSPAITAIPHGTNVKLVAEPENNYELSEWGGTHATELKNEDGSAWTSAKSGDNAYLVMNAAKSISATFAQAFAVTATADPVAGGTVTGGRSYSINSTATLVATPATGYEIDNWTTGSGESQTTVTTGVTTNQTTGVSTYEFTVTEAVSVTAHFKLKEYTLTFTASPTGGTVSATSTADGTDGKYKHGTNATLSATPSEGYRLSHWTDGSTTIPKGNDNTYTFSMTSDKTVNAVFVKIFKVTFTVDADNGKVTDITGATKDEEDYYADSGATVTFKVTPEDGFVVDTVKVDSEELIATGDVYSVKVEEEVSITITFKEGENNG